MQIILEIRIVLSVAFISFLSSIPIVRVHSVSVSSTVDEDRGAEIRGLDYLESPVSDGTIEENFEEELVNAPITAFNSIHSPSSYDDDEDEDFSDVSQYGIVEVVGDDIYGRKIITVTACKLPNSAQLNHQRLLRLERLFLGA